MPSSGPQAFPASRKRVPLIQSRWRGKSPGPRFTSQMGNRYSTVPDQAYRPKRLAVRIPPHRKEKALAQIQELDGQIRPRGTPDFEMEGVGPGSAGHPTAGPESQDVVPETRPPESLVRRQLPHQIPEGPIGSHPARPEGIRQRQIPSDPAPEKRRPHHLRG